MSSCISVGEQYIFVSNMRFATLRSFALEVAEATSRSEEERDWVQELRRWEDEEWFNGTDFDMDERFPTVEEKKFWAAVFFDVADAVFRRELGNQTITTWQASAIGDAWIIARMLTTALQWEEHGGSPPKRTLSDDDDTPDGPTDIRG